jgi:hypothetical protein
MPKPPNTKKAISSVIQKKKLGRTRCLTGLVVFTEGVMEAVIALLLLLCRVKIQQGTAFVVF